MGYQKRNYVSECQLEFFIRKPVVNRGYLNSLAANPAYIASEKHWHITLQQTTCYWYDLIINPPEFADTKYSISSRLKELRRDVEETLEKRFIYFFVSRTKIRFDVSRPPKYSLFGKKLVINILVGRDKKRRRIALSILDVNSKKSVTPEVEVTDSFIRFIHSEELSFTYSIHDFLQSFDIDLGITSEVHYVGMTKDPSDRPLSREHRGITDTLYNVSNEDNDFFIYINLFKVLSDAKNHSHGLHFLVANSLIDEVPTQEEGNVIESVLIEYFNCASQDVNRKKEKGLLTNQLISLAAKSNIQSISAHIEIDPINEYFIFGSKTVPAKPNHSFKIHIVDGTVKVETFSSEDELRNQVKEMIE